MSEELTGEVLGEQAGPVDEATGPVPVLVKKRPIPASVRRP